MNHDFQQKIGPQHLKRHAYLYVRQSTLRQVLENTESTQRQYALRDRAVALGWPLECVIVIDSDLGQSGASAVDREGFQRLVSEVGLGRAGIVLGLEVSRLARNCADWHRLLEICAVTDTLILDEDGLYDPGHFNDRLLLGLKGTFSEAELHVLRARLRGGILNKARRGELKNPLPVGLVYDDKQRVILDPDQQVQQAIRTLFATFERTGSATATVKFFGQQGLLFPRRLRRGVHKGQLLWVPLVHHRVLQVLHNPRYAGAFFHGRVHSRQDENGRKLYKVLPVEEWHTLLPETHPGYISWEQYQNHLRRLRENSQAHGKDRRHGPAGEGPALLQGLVMCGICGQRMTVCYHTRSGGLAPSYVCQRQGIEHGQRFCQVVAGAGLDQAIGTLLLQMMTPVTLEVALAVQQELQARWADADRLRRQQVQRARYEADLAHERFLHVDPKNRFVADALEADWNDKLRLLADAEEQYQKQSQADRATLDQQTKDKVLALASDFPRLWRDARTTDRDRKRMVRLLIEDVTLSKTDCITAHARCKGGTTHTLTLPLPLNGGKSWKTSPEVVALIDQLLDQHTDGQIAQILNDQGRHSGKGHKFTSPLVCKIRQAYRLKSRYTRLRAAGMFSVKQMARQLRVCTKTVKVWRRCGLLKAHAYNDKNQYLYERLGQRRPRKRPGLDHSDPRRFTNVFSQEPKEVQDAI